MNFDTKGRMIESISRSGDTTAYIWGYGGEYLVGTVENSSYARVEKAIGTDNMSKLSAIPEDELVHHIFSTLRARNDMKDALVSSYTCKPLVGITSETDPSGKTLYKEYDPYGRLILEKDQNGRIVKDYQYKYK